MTNSILLFFGLLSAFATAHGGDATQHLNGCFVTMNSVSNINLDGSATYNQYAPMDEVLLVFRSKEIQVNSLPLNDQYTVSLGGTSDKTKWVRVSELNSGQVIAQMTFESRATLVVPVSDNSGIIFECTRNGYSVARWQQEGCGYFPCTLDLP